MIKMKRKKFTKSKRKRLENELKQKFWINELLVNEVSENVDQFPAEETQNIIILAVLLVLGKPYSLSSSADLFIWYMFFHSFSEDLYRWNIFIHSYYVDSY